jgi:hypothetical protein
MLKKLEAAPPFALGSGESRLYTRDTVAAYGTIFVAGSLPV